MNMKLLLILNRPLLGMLLWLLAVLAANAADQGGLQRIWLDVKINDQPARFIFDTGAGGLTIMRDAAERLGLKIINPPSPYRPPPGLVAVGWTEKCRLTFWNNTIKTRLEWGQLPEGLPVDLDGTIGWPQVSKRIFSIDAATQSIKFLDHIPKEAASWTKLRVQPHSNLLNLEIPGREGKTEIIYLDTGDYRGVTFSPQKWVDWKTAHTNQPMTIDAGYTGPLGYHVFEEAWAHRIRLGPLELMDVPVQGNLFPKPTSALSAGPMFTLGLGALNQMDLIIDGKHNQAYLRPKTTPPLPYSYNRLGAAFMSPDWKSDDLVAWVADGSPACEAGIRNGDILLRIDEQDVARWRTSQKGDISFWEQPAGTQLQLTLKRGGKLFTTRAVLRNILRPGATNPLN